MRFRRNLGGLYSLNDRLAPHTYTIEYIIYILYGYNTQASVCKIHSIVWYIIYICGHNHVRQNTAMFIYQYIYSI